DNREVVIQSQASQNFGSEIGSSLAAEFAAGIYAFRAERFNAGTCGFGNSSILRTDAGNLPEVLNVLQSNIELFRYYNETLRRVLPQIRQVAVRPALHMSGLEILVWTHDPSSFRDDLAVPLDQSGTGIGQVLAI